ncbi:MAG: cytochrome-c peroxidase [Oligoflexales bacterium]
MKLLKNIDPPKFLLICLIILVAFVVLQNFKVSKKDYSADLDQLQSFSFSKVPVLEKKDLELARFGKQLFFDRRLSANGEVACVSCHKPELSFTDGKAVAEGIGKTTKNTPPLVNVFSGYWFFWDGRADSLEAQALGPIEASAEHGLDRWRLANLLKKYYSDEYERNFGPWPEIPKEDPSPKKARNAQLDQRLAQVAVDTLRRSLKKEILAKAKEQGVVASEVFLKEHIEFPATIADSGVSAGVDLIAGNFARAIAAFERTIVAVDSPFDNFVNRFSRQDNGDVSEAFGEGFGEDQWLGYQLFVGKGQCVLCHNGPSFSDQQFHNIGSPPAVALQEQTTGVDLGRAIGLLLAKESAWNCLGKLLPRSESESCRELPYLNTVSQEALGAFKTPTLRNVALTAPYLHDGSMASLQEVLEAYNELRTVARVGHREETLKPLGFSEKDLWRLEQFLHALTSPVRVMVDEEP